MSIVNNGLSGALAAQAALSASSQNIANVMTPGYTRQGVLLSTVIARQTGTLSAGDGVQVPSLIRFSDGYKMQQKWLAASDLAQYGVAQPYLTQLEQVVGDESSSINAGLDGFFGALNAASVEPSSNPLRQQVLTAADALAQRFNNLSQVLANQRTSIAQQRTSVVEQVNTVTADIADLNRRIALAQATGVNASGLIDARDARIDDLAAMVSVRSVDQPDGSRSVSLIGGQPLVVASSAATLSVQGNPDGSHTLQIVYAKESFTVTGSRLGGQLGGLEEFESQVLQPLRQSITDIAVALSDNVNATLAAGYALDGTAGMPLFEADPTSTTGLLAVRAGLVAGDLAFSSDPAAPGNSDSLMALIALKEQPIPVSSLGSVAVGDANTQLVGKLAMHSQKNQSSLATAQTVRDQAEESWKSTSGVNSDEEAVNLIQYQQMYQANLKVIAVANELFDSTLAMM
jgi:flagellar hook-associated protein 1